MEMTFQPCTGAFRRPGAR